MKDDKHILLEVGDGPEGIQIYTSDDEGIDWACTYPPVYIVTSLWGAQVKLGPFTLPGIYNQLKDKLK